MSVSWHCSTFRDFLTFDFSWFLSLFDFSGRFDFSGPFDFSGLFATFGVSCTSRFLDVLILRR